MKRFETGKHYGYDGGDVMDVKSRTKCFVTVWSRAEGTRRYRITVEAGDDVERVRVGGVWFGADREVGPDWSDDAEWTLEAWAREAYLGLDPSPTVIERIRDLAWDVAYNHAHSAVTADDVACAIRNTRPLLPYLA